MGLGVEDGGWKGRQAQEIRKLIQKYSFSRQDTDGPPNLGDYPKVASNNYKEGDGLEEVFEGDCQDWGYSLQNVHRNEQEGGAALKRRDAGFAGRQQHCERLRNPKARYYDSSQSVTDTLCVPDTGSNTIDYAKAESEIQFFCAQKGNFTLDASSPVTNIDEFNSEDGRGKKGRRREFPGIFNIAVDLGSSFSRRCRGRFVVTRELCKTALEAAIGACGNKKETRGGFARTYVLCREIGGSNANRVSVDAFNGRQWSPTAHRNRRGHQQQR